MRIRFGAFELDDERYVLTRDGATVELRPKVFDLLVRLVRERHRVVRREELFAGLWSTTAVGPGSLAGLVNELRRALGEDGRGRSSIRTVHARGYQFAAAVEVEVEVEADVEVEVETVAPASFVASKVAAHSAPNPDPNPDATRASAASASPCASGGPMAAAAFEIDSALVARLQRAFVEVQRAGPRAIVALIPERGARASWLGAAGEGAQALGFVPRGLRLPTALDPDGEDPVRFVFRSEADIGAASGLAEIPVWPGSRTARAVFGGREPIVLCLDVEAEADWRRAGGLSRCLDLMGRAPVLVVAALAATGEAETIRALVDGDPRIDCLAWGTGGDPATLSERGPELAETLRRLAEIDRVAFERALRGMGFESQSGLPVRSLRRVEPGAAPSSRSREREVG